MSGGLGKSVCIIGAGALGLVATKNFLEEGFDVTTFERNAYVGGLWHHTKDTTQTSAHPATRSNISKQGACYSDFPYADDVSIHPTAKEQQMYLESYAGHFALHSSIKLSTSVAAVERDDARRKWVITTKPTNIIDPSVEHHAFDRLIIATGTNGKRTMPVFAGQERFEGQILHSQQFKDASKFKDKRVVVVGLSHTAADTIQFLKAAGAQKVYVSHKRSPILVPTTVKGKALDHGVTRRLTFIGALISSVSPPLGAYMMEKYLLSLQNTTWPALKDHPAFATTRASPSVASSVPTMSATLALNLLDGSAESVQRIDRISGAQTVQLVDGSELPDIDAIICCTGDNFDISGLVPAEYDPTNAAFAPDEFSAFNASAYFREDYPVPRLYRNFLSLREPHSLAFLGYSLYRRPVFALYDLMTMALAQLWKGEFPMPSRLDMEANADKHYTYIVSELQNGHVNHNGLTGDIDFDVWLNKAAGTQLYERLGWGRDGWKLWWGDRKLYSMLMDGVDSPHAMRLFETPRGRKSWEGARAAIEEANAEVEELGKKWQEEQHAGKAKVAYD
ncbi:hypothetical protein LTR36_007478 [Oleoguttula mirabilis]|uniref:Flavin-containing monooxygenase n=1 Tax=Oleoguttula mirabilis TaxID=1507867 RepID=A0AAV9J9J7_9PEZI|nr:hypothetical protein LTR36_007478 [Oleoguttula mirabilis]